MKSKILSTVLFALILLALPVVTLLWPKTDFSQMENRMLAKAPVPSLQTIKDRSFMNGVEDYFSDHFFGRDSWVAVKGYLEYFSGKRENNKVFICGDRLIEDIPEPDMGKTQKNIDAVKKFVKKNQLPTYLMLVPTASEIYRDKLPYGYPSWDQHQYIKETVAKQLAGIANEIDIYKALYEHRSEYLYYRTDHHWTTLGACYAFGEAAGRLGLYSSGTKDYDIANISHNFYGTLYSKVGYRSIQPDIISLYSKRDAAEIAKVEVFDGKKTAEYSSLYFKDFLQQKDQYSVFLGQNQPRITITTNNTGNTNSKRILVFKDSYANSFVPFLTDYYSTITMVDLRYINESYTSLVNMSDYDQVLLLYNVDSFAQSSDISKLGVG
ncbi:DHHW family protein [Acetanaerobacterium elongatum]|uniref:DHHW protein n=1 Tax=Acetanaerobacterium elongatum TaxID=258515 RepID=A0A1H0BZD3_9FIRM|nr:DHHW family protein [Acetanaerobacterium elongatum]SDN50969.1 DHHW protein [Acetanaerobacterium elongatum]